VDYEFTVPANTTATLILQAESPKQVTESGRRIKRSEGITDISDTGNQVRMRLASGTYRFRVED